MANGRRSSLDDISDKVLKEKVSEAHQRKPNLTLTQFSELMSEEMKLSANRAGRISDGFVSKYLLDTTIQRLRLRTQIGQEKTEPQMIAERDPLSCLSTLVMFSTIYKKVPCKHLISNFDASTFFVGGFKEKGGQITLKLEDDDNTPMTAPEGPGKSIRIGIKWYAIINAAGKSGPFVFLFEDPDLPAEDFSVFEVPGLCLNDASDAFGYVCFTKTRAGNSKFYNWLIGDIIAPWLVAQRTLRSKKMNSPAVITCDGEDVQILEFAEPALVKTLNDCNIMQGKSSAVCSGNSQQLDAYKLFCTVRANVEKCLHVREDNEELSAKLFDTAFAWAGYSHAYWDTSKCKRAVAALIVLHQAIQKSLNSSIIKKSYAETGLVDLNGKLNIVQIFKKFGFNLTATHLAWILDDLPRAEKLFEKNGTLTDDELLQLFSWTREYQVVKRLVPVTTPRDQLTISRRRCVMLLNPNVQPEITERRKKLKSDAKLRLKAHAQAAKARLQKSKENKGAKRKKPADGAGPHVQVADLYKKGNCRNYQCINIFSLMSKDRKKDSRPFYSIKT